MSQNGVQTGHEIVVTGPSIYLRSYSPPSYHFHLYKHRFIHTTPTDLCKIPNNKILSSTRIGSKVRRRKRRVFFFYNTWTFVYETIVVSLWVCGFSKSSRMTTVIRLLPHSPNLKLYTKDFVESFIRNR